jgi:hypothetical protein
MLEPEPFTAREEEAILFDSSSEIDSLFYTRDKDVTSELLISSCITVAYEGKVNANSLQSGFISKTAAVWKSATSSSCDKLFFSCNSLSPIISCFLL